MKIWWLKSDSDHDGIDWQKGKSFWKVGGARRIGLLSKKLTGFRSKLDVTVGITGKSSWHGMWWNPTVYHNTISLLSIGRSLFLIIKIKLNQYKLMGKMWISKFSFFFFSTNLYLSDHTASVSSPLLWYTKSPPAHCSDRSYAVTHIYNANTENQCKLYDSQSQENHQSMWCTWLFVKALRSCGGSSWSSKLAAFPPGTTLYPAGFPNLDRLEGLITWNSEGS